MVEDNTFPFKHRCSVFDWKTSPDGRVECYCALCKRFVCEIEINVEDFDIKQKKVYPKFDEAQYHPVNLAMWV